MCESKRINQGGKTMKTKGQKGFSIVNIIVGVILTIAGIIMFGQTDTYPGPFIVVPLGLLFWIWGAVTLRKLRAGQGEDGSLKTTLTVNLVLFVIGCVLLAACVLLPVIAPRL